MTLEQRARDVAAELIAWATVDSRTMDEQRDRIAAALVDFAREHAELAVRAALKARPQMQMHTPKREPYSLNAFVEWEVRQVATDDTDSVRAALAAAEREGA